MKLLLTLALLSLTTISFAKEIPLNYNRGTLYRGEFKINKDLGRAWVQLNFSTGLDEGDYTELKIQVEGMKYDLTTKEVYIEDEAGRVVCAFEKNGMFGIKTLKETKNCQFKTIHYTKTEDDGFEIRTIKMQKIVLVY